MPPYELWLQTHDDIAKWCLGPGIGCRGLAPDPDPGERLAGIRPVQAGRRTAACEPWSLQVVEIAGDRISGITFFLDTARFFPLFGLPPRLD